MFVNIGDAIKLEGPRAGISWRTGAPEKVKALRKSPEKWTSLSLAQFALLTYEPILHLKSLLIHFPNVQRMVHQVFLLCCGCAPRRCFTHRFFLQPGAESLTGRGGAGGSEPESIENHRLQILRQCWSSIQGSFLVLPRKIITHTGARPRRVSTGTAQTC